MVLLVSFARRRLVLAAGFYYNSSLKFKNQITRIIFLLPVVTGEVTHYNGMIYEQIA